MKKEVMVVVAIVVLILAVGFVSLFVFEDFAITGRATTEGKIGVILAEADASVFISSPENTTYTFGWSDDLEIDLNVSDDFSATIWNFTLEDLKHNTVTNQTAPFTPNSTIAATRWGNRITVYGENATGSNATRFLNFYVSLPNRAPVLDSINSSISVCENASLDYRFNATDLDEDTLYFSINPVNPFYIETASTNLTGAEARIYVGLAGSVLNKDYVGTYDTTISVSDIRTAEGGASEAETDTAKTNITVIEINNVPVIDTIGVQTVWTSGESNSFLNQIDISDTEDGDENSGNFSINITFANGEDLFEISENGTMDYTPSVGDVSTTPYDITVCVTDLGLPAGKIHENISLCGQDGLNRTDCESFQLTVTSSNRAPTISSTVPVDQSPSTLGTSAIEFSISDSDADGTIPDAYWYIDGVFAEYDTGSSSDSFSKVFGCGVSGTRNVSVDVTDGALNSSYSWDVTVQEVACPVDSGSGSSGGSSGGAGITGCVLTWACQDWGTCKHAPSGLASGVLSSENYQTIHSVCVQNSWEDEDCGYQERPCLDVNGCNRASGNLSTLQACIFVENPTCSDGVQNCHDGSCEILIDCGGPCLPCATCSDGIINHGEEGVDCGGPCPNLCGVSALRSITENKTWVYGLLIIIFILIIISLAKLRGVVQAFTELRKSGKRKTRKTGRKYVFLFFFAFFLLLPLVVADNSLAVTGNVAGCFPEYICGDWSGCVDDFKIRTCEDKRCGHLDITERIFCGTDCIPEVECTNWGQCYYTEKVNDIFNGKVHFGGYQKRICEDSTGCLNTFEEERTCEDSFDLELDIYEECGERYLATIDSKTKRPVAKINLDSWETDKLDISFTQGKVIYCEDCYNGIMDGSEKGIDCGGRDCKPCQENKVSWNLIPVLFWVLSVLFSVLFVKEIVVSKKVMREIPEETF